jgi:hypothetical protein
LVEEGAIASGGFGPRFFMKAMQETSGTTDAGSLLRHAKDCARAQFVAKQNFKNSCAAKNLDGLCRLQAKR